MRFKAHSQPTKIVFMTPANDNAEVTKACTKCGEVKPLSEFYKAAGCVLGVRGECKKCTIDAQRESKRKRLQDPAAKERHLEYYREYRAKNADRLNARTRERYALNDKGFRDRREARRNSPEVKAYQREYQRRRQDNPEYVANEKIRKSTPEYISYMQSYRKKRYDNDNEYKLGIVLRSFVKRAIKCTDRKSRIGVYDALGYDATSLRKRIECQFLPGMSWDNHGEWHIDHKKPVAEFLRQGVTDPKIVNMLCNLQPMWAAENLRKKDKWKPLNDNNIEVK